MSRSIIIANRLREILLNGRWIAGTNYKEQIVGLSWEQATRKIGTLHTIAALTFHINYYLNGLLNVFNGGKLTISDKYSFDLLPIESERHWRQLVDSFLSNSEKFAAHVAQITDKQLDEPFAEDKYGSYLRNIEGVIEHSYYHLGQIVLIRKMILENSV